MSINSDIINAYHDVLNFKMKKQILSLIVNIYSKETIMSAFGISQQLVDNARKYLAKKKNETSESSTEKIYKKKLDSIKIEVFLDFICSENYLQDFAYGSRLLVITKSYSINMPNVIRFASHSKIISDYCDMCKKTF